MLLYFHPLNQTFLDHKHPKLHITVPRVLIHTNPELPFCAVLLTGFCFIQSKQLVIVVTSRRHCLQAESLAAVVSFPVIDAWCSKFYRFACVLNCPDDGGSKPVRIFSSLISLFRASYPARVVYWFSLRDFWFSQWCCWKDGSPRMLALSLLGEWFLTFGRTVVILSLVSSSPKEWFSFCIARGATRGRSELSIKRMKSAVMSIVVNETKSKLCLDFSRW